jgi:hypothetical protein
MTKKAKKVIDKSIYSILNTSEFLTIVNKAKTPLTLFDNTTHDEHKWLENKYIFDDAVICSIPIEYEQMERTDFKIPFICYSCTFR